MSKIQECSYSKKAQNKTFLLSLRMTSLLIKYSSDDELMAILQTPVIVEMIEELRTSFAPNEQKSITLFLLSVLKRASKMNPQLAELVAEKTLQAHDTTEFLQESKFLSEVKSYHPHFLKANSFELA